MAALEAKKKRLATHLAGQRVAQMACCPEQAPARPRLGFRKGRHRRCCPQSQSAFDAAYQVAVRKLWPTE